MNGRDLFEDTPIEELELSVRAYRCLLRAEVLTVGQIECATDGQLLRIEGLGHLSVKQIRGIVPYRRVSVRTKRPNPLELIPRETLEEMLRRVVREELARAKAEGVVGEQGAEDAAEEQGFSASSTKRNTPPGRMT